MKKKDVENKENEITSLSTNLHEEYQIKELEDRLETDPLLGGLFTPVQTNTDAEARCFGCICAKEHNFCVCQGGGFFGCNHHGKD